MKISRTIVFSSWTEDAERWGKIVFAKPSPKKTLSIGNISENRINQTLLDHLRLFHKPGKITPFANALFINDKKNACHLLLSRTKNGTITSSAVSAVAWIFPIERKYNRQRREIMGPAPFFTKNVYLLSNVSQSNAPNYVDTTHQQQRHPPTTMPLPADHYASTATEINR